MTAPIDDYILNAFVFVTDKATNEFLYTTRLAATDPLNNFVTFSRDTEATDKFTYDTGNGTVAVDVESRAFVLTISRPVPAQAFRVCLLLVNLAIDHTCGACEKGEDQRRGAHPPDYSDIDHPYNPSPFRWRTPIWYPLGCDYV